MSAPALLPRLILPRSRALFGRLVIAAIIPVAVLAFLVAKSGNPHHILFVLLFIVGQVSAVLTVNQKAVLAATFVYVQPGIRRDAATSHVVWALALAGAVAGALALLAEGPLPPLAAIVGSVLMIYVLCALAGLEWPWSFQLPLWLYYVFFLFPVLGRMSADGRMAAALDPGWPWLAAGVVLLGLLWLRVRSRSLQRKLCGTLVLRPEDVFRPGRVQDLKAHRSRHARAGRGMGWRASLLGMLLARAAMAAGRGETATARAWLLLNAGLAGTVTRRLPLFLLAVFLVVVMLLCGGYYDSRTGGDLNEGWFSTLVFSWAAIPVLAATYAMTNTTMRPTARGDGLRSELIALAWTTPAVLGTSLLFQGTTLVLSETLPSFVIGNRLHTFLMPAPHALLLPVSLGPIIWLGAALGRRSSAQVAAGAMGPAFFIGHGVLTMVPYRWSIPIWLGISLAAGLTAYTLRRRWWRRGDQTV